MKIVDIIKYEGENDVFVWKHPCEDFNTGSKLIVHETQEAVLFLNGQALDLFTKGEYTLKTQNIPLLRHLINLPTDGETPFHCEVYFINKVEQMNIPWGVGDILFTDPTNGIPFKIGARGQMSLRADDSRKLLVKLVGTTKGLTQSALREVFQPPIIQTIKERLPELLEQKQTSIIHIERNLSSLANELKKQIAEEMRDYGICLEKFYVEGVQKPEDDPNYKKLLRIKGEKGTLLPEEELEVEKLRVQERLKKQEMEMQKTLAAIEREKKLIEHSGTVAEKEMDVRLQALQYQLLGITKEKELTLGVLKSLAENEGAGADVRNALIGFSSGMATGGILGGAFAGLANNAMSSLQSTPVPQTVSSPFGSVPGAIDIKPQEKANSLENKAEPSRVDPVAQFKQKTEMIRIMYENHMLSEEQYQEQIKQLQNEIMNGGSV